MCMHLSVRLPPARLWAHAHHVSVRVCGNAAGARLWCLRDASVLWCLVLQQVEFWNGVKNLPAGTVEVQNC